MTSLAAFKGIAPNGTWSLYVADDTRQLSGKIANGWKLTLATVAATPTLLSQMGPPASNAKLMALEASLPPRKGE